MNNTIEKLVEHVYGSYGYSRLKYNGTDHEINWSLSNDGKWNYSTEDQELIAAFESTF